MNSISKDQKVKIDTAFSLLLEETTTFAKFEKICTLLNGIHPDVDKAVGLCTQKIKILKKIQKGEVIELAASVLPEDTEEQKKRKKLLLLFIVSWKDLRKEVKRVMDIFEKQGQQSEDAIKHINTFGRIISLAKGPFGIITAVAVVIVGASIVLKSVSVSINVRNQGCAPITPLVQFPVAIPGLQLPSQSIPSGGQAKVIIPPLTITVDATKEGVVNLIFFKFSMDYNLSGSRLVLLFDNQSLLGKSTTINLGNSKEHELVLRCTN